MACQRSLCLLLLLVLTGLMGWSEAYQFNVGGKEGWVLNPSENYNHWAGRMRFQVNDTLFFKYNKGSDSVLVVSKQDYDNCNTQKPIVKMEDGDSVFKFGRSGPFYFITGNKSNCDQGQKLIVVVLAVRNKPTSPPPSPAAGAPSPLVQTPSPSPNSPSPSPSTPSPSPVEVPVPSPTPTVSPSPAITPESQTPAVSPEPATASTPSITPITPSPSTISPPSDNAPAPGGTPANIAPPHSSAPAFSPSVVVFISSVTLALSVYTF